MVARTWTECEINLLTKYFHLSDREIGTKLQRSLSSVKWKRQKLGLFKDTKKRITKYEINLSFFKFWGSEMAYVLGFIFADGCIRIYPSRFEYSLKIEIKDLNLLKKINKVMKSEIPIKVQQYKTGMFYELSIFRKSIVDDLLKLGLTPRKSLTLKFPQTPLKFFFDFLRGYFDGDGSVIYYRGRLRINMTSGTKSFLEKIKESLDLFGIKTSLKTKKVKNRKNPWYVLFILSENRRLFYDKMYKDATIYLKRKYDVFTEYFNRPIPMMNCLDCNYSIRKYRKHHVRCSACSKKHKLKRGKQLRREKRFLANLADLS